MSEVKLLHGDCLDLMQSIPDKSVDMVLCDLPYGTITCSWDNIIPFDLLWKQYRRVIKNNGIIALFGSQPFSSLLVSSNLKNFREELIWLKNKPASGFRATQRHMKIHEQIEIFAPSAKYTYNPQKWLVEDKEFLTQRKTFKDNVYIGNRIYGATTRSRKPDTGERNPISIVSCRIPFTPQNSKLYSDDVELRYHPTQKPVTLLEYLIKTYTNEGETVLDNCMGSGSTGVACVNTGRKFIGIELDKGYYEIAEQRIAAAEQGSAIAEQGASPKLSKSAEKNKSLF